MTLSLCAVYPSPAVEKSLFKNFIYKITLSFFNVVIPVLIIPYVYRILGPANIGLLEYSNSIFMYFFLIGGLGVYSYGMREVAAVRNDPDAIARLFSSLLTVSALSNILVLCAYAAFVAVKAPASGIQILLAVMGLNFISNIIYVEWLNEAFENFRFITVKTVIVRTLFVGAILFFVRSPDDVVVY
ncbi:MAG: oligosaccharide flippase family protein, partial [Spirochaetota bacterium]